MIPGTASMSATPAISISNVIVAEIDRNAIFLPIKIESKRNKERIIETKALLDMEQEESSLTRTLYWQMELGHTH